MALGHNHPVTRKAILDYMETGGPLQLLDMATPVKSEFMKTLLSTFPEELANDCRLHFASPAGTDALDAAVKLCKIATGRRTVLSFHGGYHGHGTGTLAMMGNLGAKTPVTGLMPDVHFVPFPYQFRNPMGLSGQAGEDAVLNYIETVLGDDESGITLPACLVIEAIQGEGGVNPISPSAMRRLRQLCTERGIPMVVDEVQAGFCRSGDFYAFNESGIVPDVLCVSKAVGGSMPLAVVAFKKSLDKWGPGAHTGTFRGNSLAFAAGTASIRYLQDTQMHQQVRAKGAAVAEQIKGWGKPFIGDVRGRGLMQGIEMVDPEGTPCGQGLLPPNGPLAARTQVECVKRGLILERGGRQGAVLRLLPPLTITPAQLTTCVSILGEAMDAADAYLKQQ